MRKADQCLLDFGNLLMIFRGSYTQDWEALAQTDPLFAVLTHDEYQRAALTPESERQFWSSGETYIQHLSDLFRDHFGRTLAPQRALDFGCGVGRLLVPLARLSGSAIGVDASPTMRSLARDACGRAALSNVSFEESVPPGATFDFVNSALVFQHIPVRVGLPIFESLLRGLTSDGLLAVQMLYARRNTTVARVMARWLNAHVQPVNVMINRFRGRASNAPHIQMNPYPMDRLLRLLTAHGMGDIHLIASSIGGFENVLILAHRK